MFQLQDVLITAKENYSIKNKTQKKHFSMAL